MSYIKQYIRESQARYPSISKTPADVLSHMLFTNGNGVEMTDGNFVVLIGFWREVPFTEYYKQEKTFEQLKEHIDEYGSEQEIEEEYKLIKQFNPEESDEKNWKEAVEVFYSRYNELDIVDNYTLEDLKNKDVFLKMIKTDREYAPYLSLSEEYFKMYHFNDNTEKDLLEISLALSEAYLMFLNELILNPETIMESPVCGTRDELITVYNRDVKMLTRMIEKVNNILKKGEENE